MNFGGLVRAPTSCCKNLGRMRKVVQKGRQYRLLLKREGTGVIHSKRSMPSWQHCDHLRPLDHTRNATNTIKRTEHARNLHYIHITMELRAGHVVRLDADVYGIMRASRCHLVAKHTWSAPLSRMSGCATYSKWPYMRSF